MEQRPKISGRCDDAPLWSTAVERARLHLPSVTDSASITVAAPLVPSDNPVHLDLDPFNHEFRHVPRIDDNSDDLYSWTMNLNVCIV